MQLRSKALYVACAALALSPAVVCADPMADELAGARRTRFFAGVSYGRPLGFALSAGVVRGRYRPETGGESWPSVDGPLLRVEVGQRGVKLAAGFGSVSEFSGGGALLNDVLPFIAFGASAVAIQTWRSRDLSEPGGTYLGVELGASFCFVKLQGGLLLRASGGEVGAGRWSLSYGVGAGF